MPQNINVIKCRYFSGVIFVIFPMNFSLLEKQTLLRNSVFGLQMWCSSMLTVYNPINNPKFGEPLKHCEKGTVLLEEQKRYKDVASSAQTFYASSYGRYTTQLTVQNLENLQNIDRIANFYQESRRYQKVACSVRTFYAPLY